MTRLRQALRKRIGKPWPAPTMPGTPLNLAVTQASDTELALTWDLADALDTAVLVERSNDGVSGWSQVASLAGGWRTWTDRSLTPATTKFYRVKAQNGGGTSSPTAGVSATTAADGSNAGNTLSGFSVTANSAWQITVGMTSPATPVGTTPNVCVERSSDGGLTYAIIALFTATSGTPQTFVDTPLSPSTTYWYRCRLTTGSAYGPYTTPASATTSAKTAGFPDVPTGLSASSVLDTSAVISWTDTNAGTASYKVETAPIPGGGTPATAVWTQQTQTAVGATSYTLTTVAKTPVYVRVRASNGTGDSAYTSTQMLTDQGGILTVRPSSTPAVGGPKTYHIGPAQTYATFTAFESAVGFAGLGPGDTVNVHGNGTTAYTEKICICCRGTAANPIIIQGVADGGGNLPIIDGLSATTASTVAPGNGTTFEDLSLVLIHRKSGDPSGYQPGYLTFKNFVVKRGCSANSPNTYTAHDGTTRTYLAGAGGIYIASGDNINIGDVGAGCEVSASDNGLFFANDGTSLREISDVTLQYSYIHDNGISGSSSRHNVYVEGANFTAQYNHIGPVLSGSLGCCLKVRCAGNTIRYNWIGGGSQRLLDCVELQNSILHYFPDSRYRKSYVYGNVFYNDGSASTPIHYGGDSSGDWYYRQGVLIFAHNTFANIFDAATQARVQWFYTETGTEVCAAVNNIYYVEKATGPGTRPEVDLFATPSGPVPGIGVFGPNYVTTGWNNVRVGGTYSGHAQGTSAFVSPVGNSAGFTDGTTTGQDFTLAVGSPCLAVAGRLPDDHPAVDHEYVKHQQATARALWGTGTDLGYYERT